MSKKRKSMTRKASKKVFSRTAMKTHKKNMLPRAAGPMRGGIRL